MSSWLPEAGAGLKQHDDCRQQMRSLHSDRQIELHYVGMDTPADSTEFYDRHNMKCLQDNSTIKQKQKP